MDKWKAILYMLIAAMVGFVFVAMFLPQQLPAFSNYMVPIFACIFGGLAIVIIFKFVEKKK